MKNNTRRIRNRNSFHYAKHVCKIEETNADFVEVKDDGFYIDNQKVKVLETYPNSRY